MFPEARTIVDRHFAALVVVELVDGAGEEAGVCWETPEADAGEGDGDDGVVEFHRLRLYVEKVLVAVCDDDFFGRLVVGETGDGGLEDGAVEDLGAEGCGELGEALVDCAPFGGGEVDAII